MWVAAAVRVALVALTTGAVEPAAQARRVTYAEALALAERTGEVEGTARAAEAKGALERGLTSLPGNPEVEVQQGHTSQPDATGNYSQLSIRQPLSLSGFGPARREAAAAETRALSGQARAAALSRQLAAAEAWTGLWGAQSALSLAAEEEALAAAFLGKVEEALPLGGTTRLEVAEARSYAAEAELVHRAAEGVLVEARLALSRTLGLPARPAVWAEGAPPAPALVRDAAWWQEEEARLLARASGLPEVAWQKLAAEAARARVREARAQAGWQLSVGAVGQLQFQANPTAYGVLALTPPLFEQGAREAAQASAEATRAEGLVRDALASAEATLSGALHDVEHTGEVYATLSGRLVPATAEAAELAALLFAHGQSSVLDVLRARRALATARGRLLSAQAESALAGLRLHLLRTALP